MKEYVIITDATADLPQEIVRKHGVKVIPMTVTFSDDDRVYSTEDQDYMSVEFYNRLKKGDIATTAQINIFQFIDAFESVVELGFDLLYLGFSSQLSGTFEAAEAAAKRVKEKYSDANIEVIDTLAASAGQGLIVIKAAELKKQGKGLAETSQYIKDSLQFLNSWATVGDLAYLSRGGRIGATEAFLGGVLNVKPIIHLNSEGKLLPVKKVRGRKQALRALVDVMSGFEPGYSDLEVFVAHGNCLNDAEFLASMIEEAYGPKKIHLTSIGPIIGAHIGPDALALFFWGNERTVQGV